MDEQELKELLDEADLEYKNGITAFYRLSDILETSQRQFLWRRIFHRNLPNF